MTIIIFLISWVGLLAVVRRLWRTSGVCKAYFLPALIFKVFAGVCFGALYVFHYKEGDSLTQFEIGSRLYELFEENISNYFLIIVGADDSIVGMEPRSAFFIRILSLINIMALNNYWVSTIFITLIGFIAIWTLAIRIKLFYNVDIRLLLASLVFFPSIAFWTSGLVKESVTYAAMCVIIWSILPIIQNSSIKWKEVLLGVISFIILWKLKYYHAGILLIVLIPLLIDSFLKARGLSQKKGGFVIAMALILTAFLVSTMHYNLNLYRVLDVIVENNQAYFNHTSSERVIHFQELEPTLMSIVCNWPTAIFQGVFGPQLWQSWNMLSFLQSIENSILLLLVLISLRYWWRSIQINPVMTILALAYILIMATLLSLSTPNYGTLSRYKVAYLPVLIFFVLYSLPINSWLKKIRPSKDLG